SAISFLIPVLLPPRSPLFPYTTLFRSLHQTMIFSLRLDRQAIKHARLTNCEIADVDHFLHFAFALGHDLSSLERHQLTELMFRRSEEHTSELQSRVDLVCRLLLEKKKK